MPIIPKKTSLFPKTKPIIFSGFFTQLHKLSSQLRGSSFIWKKKKKKKPLSLFYFILVIKTKNTILVQILPT